MTSLGKERLRTGGPHATETKQVGKGWMGKGGAGSGREAGGEGEGGGWW